MSQEIKQFPIPDKIIPESRKIVEMVLSEQRATQDFDLTEYGHISLNLVNGLTAAGEVFDPVRQKAHLRKCAFAVLKQFGPRFLDGFIRPELLSVLTPEEIEEIKKMEVK